MHILHAGSSVSAVCHKFLLVADAPIDATLVGISSVVFRSPLILGKNGDIFVFSVAFLRFLDRSVSEQAPMKWVPYYPLSITTFS